jgi:hypothetical protein
LKKQTNDNSLRMKPRPRFSFGELTGFFGRWIRCQRPFPAAVAEMNVLIKSLDKAQPSQY